MIGRLGSLALTLAAASACGESGHDASDRAPVVTTDAGGGAGGATGADDAGAGVPSGGAGPVATPDAGLAGAATVDGGSSGATAADGACEPGARFATSVVEHSFGDGQSAGQDRFPELVLGEPRGTGCCSGSFDVVSIGNGGSVVLAFEGTAIVDGPGPDFIVFENPFDASGDETLVFAELATVSVSDDGETWHAFDCTATAYPYGSCAGWHPVYANVDTNDIDPLDPAVAGGDPFDLADIGVERARYVRIVDRADLDGFNGVFDLDAVGIVNATCL